MADAVGHPMGRDQGQKQRQYTVEQREEATALGREVGAPEASRRLGIPRGTISFWMCRYADTWAAAPEPASEATGGATTAEAVNTSPGRVAKIYTPSQRAEILEHAGSHGVTAASRRFETSRWTIYSWRRQLKRAAAGEGPSPTSGPDPADVAAKRDGSGLQGSIPR